MKHFKYLLLLLFVSFTLILTTTPAADAGITCAPSGLNFGEIQVGTSSTMTITCTASLDNYSTHTWTIDGALVQGGEIAFTLTPDEFTLPYSLSPGESVDIFVEFSPTIVNTTYQAPYDINGTWDDGRICPTDDDCLPHWVETSMMQGNSVYFEMPPTVGTGKGHIFGAQEHDAIG